MLIDNLLTITIMFSIAEIDLLHGTLMARNEPQERIGYLVN